MGGVYCCYRLSFDSVVTCNSVSIPFNQSSTTLILIHILQQYRYTTDDRDTCECYSDTYHSYELHPTLPPPATISQPVLVVKEQWRASSEPPPTTHTLLKAYTIVRNDQNLRSYCATRRPRQCKIGRCNNARAAGSAHWRDSQVS